MCMQVTTPKGERQFPASTIKKQKTKKKKLTSTYFGLPATSLQRVLTWRGTEERSCNKELSGPPSIPRSLSISQMVASENSFLIVFNAFSTVFFFFFPFFFILICFWFWCILGSRTQTHQQPSLRCLVSGPRLSLDCIRPCSHLHVLHVSKPSLLFNSGFHEMGFIHLANPSMDVFEC